MISLKFEPLVDGVGKGVVLAANRGEAIAAIDAFAPGVLCTFGPPEERKKRWVLVFEDAEVGRMYFDDQEAAIQMFKKMTDNWNCTLFVTETLVGEPNQQSFPLGNKEKDNANDFPQK